MTADDLINDLLRRAEACDALAADYADCVGDGAARCAGKAAAYRHAAELARDAVAAAVAEEREACAQLCDEQASRAWADDGWATAGRLAASIRGRAT